MSRRLIALDMDGVLYNITNFWLELHTALGTREEGDRLSKQYLHTEHDTLWELVVNGMWKRKDAQPYFDLIKSIPYMHGIEKLFDYVHNKDWFTCIISGSSIDGARRIQRDFQVDHIFANYVIIEDGKFTGEWGTPVSSGDERKAEILRGLCQDLQIPLENTIYVGDSKHDVPAIQAVGLGIAFNPADDIVREATPNVIESTNLRDLVKYLQNHTN